MPTRQQWMRTLAGTPTRCLITLAVAAVFYLAVIGQLLQTVVALGVLVGVLMIARFMFTGRAAPKRKKASDKK